MSFFGNFGSGFGRPSWSSLGINMGDSGSGGMIVGGNMGPFGSGIIHGTLAHVAQPSLASTLLNTPTVVSHMMTSPARAIAESFYPKIDLPSITPSFMTAPHVGMSTLPTMELGERLPISVPSMEMRPDAIAPTPTVTSEVSTVTTIDPVSGRIIKVVNPIMAAHSASVAPGPQIQTATEDSGEGSATERFPFGAGFQTLGDVMADENPVILPDGTKDYVDAFNAESRLQHEAETMKKTIETVADGVKNACQAVANFAQEHPVTTAAVATAVAIGTAGGGVLLAESIGAGIGLTSVGGGAAAIAGTEVGTAAIITAGAVGTKVVADRLKDMDLSFARKADGKDHAPKVGKTGPADRQAPIERKIDTPEIRNSFWDKLKQSGEWEHVTGYDNPTLRHKETGRLIQKSIEKWEIEVYNKKKEHIGVIKPSDGILREDLAVKGRTINK